MTKEESYEILCLGNNPTQNEIKRNYKQMLKKYHPDTFKFDKNYASLKTQKIIEAYRYLSNEQVPSKINIENIQNVIGSTEVELKTNHTATLLYGVGAAVVLLIIILFIK